MDTGGNYFINNTVDLGSTTNRLDGDGSPPYALYRPRQQASGIYINDNRMVRGVYGYTDSCVLGQTATEFSGNVDDATGAALGPNSVILND